MIHERKTHPPKMMGTRESAAKRIPHKSSSMDKTLQCYFGIMGHEDVFLDNLIPRKTNLYRHAYKSI